MLVYSNVIHVQHSNDKHPKTKIELNGLVVNAAEVGDNDGDNCLLFFRFFMVFVASSLKLKV